MKTCTSPITALRPTCVDQGFSDCGSDEFRNAEGTSFATPHVSAIAALIIATKRLGAHPTPLAVKQRIEQTATDLGPPGYDERYGFGLVNAAAAIAP